MKTLKTKKGKTITINKIITDSFLNNFIGESKLYDIEVVGYSIKGVFAKEALYSIIETE